MKQIIGAANVRALRLMGRSGELDAWNAELFEILIKCAREMATSTGDRRAEAHARGLRSASLIVSGRAREQRVKRYARQRAAFLANHHVLELSNVLLRLRRQLLPIEFSEQLSARGNRFSTFRDALSLLSSHPEPLAGDYCLLLAQKARSATRLPSLTRSDYRRPPSHRPHPPDHHAQVSRVAHEKPKSALARCMPSEPSPSWGECAICNERRPRWALTECGHASSCRRCVHLHCTERLRSGVAPACPLCRAPLTPGEVLHFVAPHHQVSRRLASASPPHLLTSSSPLSLTSSLHASLLLSCTSRRGPTANWRSSPSRQ